MISGKICSDPPGGMITTRDPVVIRSRCELARGAVRNGGRGRSAKRIPWSHLSMDLRLSRSHLTALAATFGGSLRLKRDRNRTLVAPAGGQPNQSFDSLRDVPRRRRDPARVCVPDPVNGECVAPFRDSSDLNDRARTACPTPWPISTAAAWADSPARPSKNWAPGPHFRARRQFRSSRGPSGDGPGLRCPDWTALHRILTKATGRG